MERRIDLLEQTTGEAARLIEGVGEDQLDSATPCEDFDVRALLNHLCMWITVFDHAVNDRRLDFDPEAHELDWGWAEHFRAARTAVLEGRRSKGSDRQMTMTSDPLPGSVVFDMLSMEYIGHGLDLATATGQEHRFTEEQATAALDASKRMISPEYRGHGPGQFHPVVEVAEDAPAIDRFVGFLGRDPALVG